VTHVFGRTDDLVFALDHIRAYPNGFTVDLVFMRNPRAEHDHGPPFWFREDRGFPRLGVEFSDGRRAGHEAPAHFPMMLNLRGELEKDEEGIPKGVVIMSSGGGGGGHDYHFGVWVFPLPPPGELKIYAEWPAIGIPESVLSLSADDILAAGEQAIVIWD
jgi:hypothetical protein